LKSFGAKFLDQWGREKRRDDDQALVGSESVHTLHDFPAGLDTPAKEVTHIKLFELGEGRHN
jgi:hypothetical protein